MARYWLLSLLLVLLGISAKAAAAITISAVWIREAPPAATALAAYLKLHNTSQKARVLSTVHSEDFAEIEIHKTMVSGDIATMVKQPQLTIAAGTIRQLSPGGYHLMLIQPKRAFRCGDTTTLHFVFKNGEHYPVTATVKACR